MACACRISTINPTFGYSCKSSDVYALCASLLELFFGPAVGELTRRTDHALRFTQTDLLENVTGEARREMAEAKKMKKLACDADDAEQPGEGWGVASAVMCQQCAAGLPP
jgi:hypothetical protein